MSSNVFGKLDSTEKELESDLFISVVVPTFNRATIIPATLRSLSAQRYRNFEVVIVDDGSEDQTEAVVRSLADPRQRYIRIPHAGACAARNAGIERAAGAVICFVDSDDTLAPGFLAAVAKAFRNSAVTHVSTNCVMTREFVRDGQAISVKPVEMPDAVDPLELVTYRKKVPLGTGMCFRTERFRGRVAWDECFPIMEEVDFFIQLFRISPNGYRYLPEKLFSYRQRHNSDGVCSNVSYAEIAETCELFYRKHSDHPLLREPIRTHLDMKAIYLAMAEREARGELAHHMYRYFPEFAPATVVGGAL
jgi:glycosyltransferase involved in cell wall biosynthesis